MFVTALVVVYLVPGPDMILLLQTAASHGRAHALATAVGLAAARATHVALAAFGLAALLETAPVAFDIVRIAGAAYLIWLGITILRAPSLLLGEAFSAITDMRHSLLIAGKRGLLSNLLNPKALLFGSVLLPQFIQPGQGGAAQFLLLDVILVLIGMVFDVAYAIVGTGLGRWLARHRAVHSAQRWILASLLIGFGLRLALA